MRVYVAVPALGSCTGRVSWIVLPRESAYSWVVAAFGSPKLLLPRDYVQLADLEVIAVAGRPVLFDACGDFWVLDPKPPARLRFLS